jgi:AcrR family transcriptional regulator
MHPPSWIMTDRQSSLGTSPLPGARLPRKIGRTARRSEITTASRVFAERGVAKTSVSDIVKAADVAEGTF